MLESDRLLIRRKVTEEPEDIEIEPCTHNWVLYDKKIDPLNMRNNIMKFYCSRCLLTTQIKG